MICLALFFFFFFFNDTATTEIYTLSLHDALPISRSRNRSHRRAHTRFRSRHPPLARPRGRSEEHTSELQSRPHLVCRLLLEKKKKKQHILYFTKETNRHLRHNDETRETKNKLIDQ